MGTEIRPEVTKRNKYWISKHRYYELKHFCLQYPEFVKKYQSFDGYARKTEPDNPKDTNFKRSIEKAILKRDVYAKRIKIIEDCAKHTDPALGTYILTAVVNNLGYNTLKTKYEIPCGKDLYYKLYRKFFWLLSGVLEELYI